jgi:hypothetical protein
VEETAVVPVHGTDTEYGESEWLCVERQLRAVTIPDVSEFRIPPDMEIHQ